MVSPAAAYRESPRRELMRMWDDMKKERDLYVPTWRMIAQYALPHAARFITDDTRRGQSKQESILNGIASQALDTASSGMASSLTNPARPWFRLTTADPSLSEREAVRDYLFQVERLVQWVFARSNIHGALVMLYRLSMGFGTGCLWVDEDENQIIRAYVFPVGSFALSASAQQRIDTVGHESEMTVRQMVQRFSLDNLTERTRRLAERREWNQKVNVLHFVCPNEDLDAAALDGRQMPFAGHWLETAGQEDDAFLLEKGYRQFPMMTGRWDVWSTSDVYGIGPMHNALPDVKQLQHTEDKKLDLLDMLTAPPLNYPGGLRGDFPSVMAGALNVVPELNGSRVEPTYVPQYQAYEISARQAAELSMRIREALHEDLWRLLTQREDEANKRPPGMTATEVVERHEEKLILLGPVVDRFHNDVLSPLIQRTIAILADRRLLPPPPRDLIQALVKGEDVRIEYLSVLAQAQRLLGLTALERYASIAGALAQGDPTVWDKIDRDEILDQAADMLGIPPNVTRSDDMVAEMRISRARKAEQMQSLQANVAASQATKNLSAPIGNDSALTRLLQSYGPAAQGAVVPQPGATGAAA